jgi:hypothetical protein
MGAWLAVHPILQPLLAGAGHSERSEASPIFPDEILTGFWMARRTGFEKPGPTGPTILLNKERQCIR